MIALIAHPSEVEYRKIQNMAPTHSFIVREIEISPDRIVGNVKDRFAEF